MKLRYEVQLATIARKIKRLKDNEQEMQIKVEMGTERIKVLLDNHKEPFMKNVVEAMEKGWEAWSTQAAELQIFHVE